MAPNFDDRACRKILSDLQIQPTGWTRENVNIHHKVNIARDILQYDILMNGISNDENTPVI
jgi:hypothetical protein